MNQVSGKPTPTNAASSGVSIDKKLSKQLMKPKLENKGIIFC
ncbi:MAG: hypothetical protein ACERLB_12790 [Gammaproteobacteria bacterium]